MPSPNPRIQVCTDPGLHAQLKTMAKGRNCTLSHIVQELCTYALQTEEIRAEYEEICETYGEVPAQPDGRKRPGQRPHYKPTAKTRKESQPLNGGLTDQQYSQAASLLRDGVITKEQFLEMVKFETSTSTPEPVSSRPEEGTYKLEKAEKTEPSMSEVLAQMQALQKQVAEMAKG